MTQSRVQPAWAVPGLAQLFDTVLDAAGDRRDLTLAERERFFETGRRSFEKALPLSQLIASYLQGAGEVWETVLHRASPDETVGIGRSLRRVSEQAVAALASGFETAQRESIRAEESTRAELREALLAEERDADDIAHWARRLGLDRSGAYTVLVASPPYAISEAGPVHRRVRDEFASRAPERWFDLFSRRGEFVLLTVLDGDGDGDEDLLVHLFTASLAAADPVDWSVGVGRTRQRLVDVADSYSEAVEAVRLLRLFDVPSPRRFDSLLAERVVAASPEAVDDLVRRVLSPLRDEPRGELLETLEAYHRHAGNMARVARELHVGARTVGYRLDRIAELTGYSPRDGEGWFVLVLALVASRISSDP